MFSHNLDYLIKEFPEERSAIERLCIYLDSVKGSVRELTVQRLYDLIDPSSQRVLVKMLQQLVKNGVFKQIVRVESDSLGGIGDYDSVVDVPKVIFDSRLGQTVEVRLDQIHLVYRLEQGVK